MSLFLGGHLHGVRFTVPPGMWEFHAPVPTQGTIARADDTAVPMITSRMYVATYVAQKVAFPAAERRVVVFYPEGWSQAWQERALADFMEYG